MVMLKRRNIREAAIQFLYLADLEDGPEAANMEEAFWQMIQESSLKKLNLAKAKAILHVAQGRDGRILKLNQLASAIQPELAAGNRSKDVIAPLKELVTQENELSRQIEALKSFLQNKSDNPVPDQMIQDAMDVNHSLIQARLTSQRLASIDDPDSTIVDFAHLRRSSSELSTFRRETQELVAHILQHKEEIDASLAGVIENYAPQRVDPVDRAILRLATYELKMSDDIPRAVTINEAIEIAKKFGTNESARFINGVLDAL